MSEHIGYGITLRVTMKTPNYIAKDKAKEDAILKQLNKNSYNDLILAQYDTVCFNIVEESVTNELPYGSTLRALEILKKKFQPIIGASKTRLRKKFAKSEFNDATRVP